MILSMTGFGKAVKVFNHKKITVEVKSLNSKQLDAIVKLPQPYRSVELDIRGRLTQQLQRGKVDVFITSENADGVTPMNINIEQLRLYKQQIEQMSCALDLPQPTDWYNTLLRLPDVWCNEQNGNEVDDDELAVVMQASDDALAQLLEFRTQEGRRLELFFEEKIAAIQQIFAEVETYESSRIERIRERIVEGLTKFESVEYDKNRLEQELIFYIEKLDITEEKIRLQNHINYFLETLHADEPGQGKKLGFIAQEMGREINTMGSKANQAELQQVVVRMKDQLEQIKEQVLNVL
ncbi:MAG: YicC family protein [Muribaculaceae bacterium]|nr:YicC family protein [Muribaculaceae bacterium]